MKDKGIQTKVIHGGENYDPHTGATIPNIVMATSYKVGADSNFSVEDQDPNATVPYVYTRWGNPTVAQLAKKLCLLEEAEYALIFSSGMAAITSLFMHLLSNGDHMIMSDVSYAGGSELANDLLSKLGVHVSRINMSNIEEVSSALRPETKLIYLESPCNPICRMTDIEAISKIAKSANVQCAIDSTFATPLATKPIELGVDFVIHSLTKYISGHGDTLGGAILGRKLDLLEMHTTVAAKLGGTISPFNAWLIMRGMATFPMRMKAHEHNAMSIAAFLESHPKVTQVIYPGLQSHPQYDLAKRQMKNFSGMINFQTIAGKNAAPVFADHLKLFHYAVSLGHHKSLLFYIDTETMLKTSFKLTREQEADYRKYAGDGFFRMSVGIETVDDLISDLELALDKF